MSETDGSGNGHEAGELLKLARDLLEENDSQERARGAFLHRVARDRDLRRLAYEEAWRCALRQLGSHRRDRIEARAEAEALAESERPDPQPRRRGEPRRGTYASDGLREEIAAQATFLDWPLLIGGRQTCLRDATRAQLLAAGRRYIASGRTLARRGNFLLAVANLLESNDQTLRDAQATESQIQEVWERVERDS